MKIIWISFVSTSLMLLIVILIWLGQQSSQTNSSDDNPSNGTTSSEVLHIGIIPERDIYRQRKRYKALADYLAGELGCQIKLVTLNTYQSVLDEFENKNIDAAFLGSMVTVLAHDRLGVKVIAKPVFSGEVHTYRGVIITREDSSIQQIQDIAGQSIAMVKTTMAGNLYPIYLLSQHGIFNNDKQPKIVWVGTHDEVAKLVYEGKVSAGALKDLRLIDYEATNPDARFRKLAFSTPVPNNSLVIRGDLDDQYASDLQRVLLEMQTSDEGRIALKRFGAIRFMLCDIDEYRVIYQMIKELGSVWKQVGVTGPMPIIDGTTP